MFGRAGGGRRRLRPGRPGRLRRLLRPLRRLLRRERRGRRRSVAAGPPSAPTCATTCGSPSRSRSGAPRRRSSSRSSTAAPPAPAAARRAGPPPRPARSAAAAARSATPARRCSARWSTSSTCPRCRGEGKVVEAPCEDCGGDGRKQRTKRLRVAVPAGIDDGHQIRLSSEGEVGPARRTAGQPLRRDPRRRPPAAAARGDRALPRARPLDRPGGARHDGPRADGRRRGGPRDQAGHPAGDRDPAPRPRRAAPAPGGRPRRPPRARRRDDPDEALARSSARRSRPTPRPPGRRTSGTGKGGVFERIKDALG